MFGFFGKEDSRSYIAIRPLCGILHILSNTRSNIQGANDNSDNTSSFEHLFLKEENLALSRHYQAFYTIVRLGISKYDVSSHDDRYARYSSQHDKSREWDASGIKGQHGSNPGVDPSEQLEDAWLWVVMPVRSDEMVDVLDLAKKLATRDNLDKCARALGKMQSARRDNWVEANTSSQVPVYIEFSLATFKLLQHQKIPSTPLNYIASARLACFRGDQEEAFTFKEHPPFVLSLKIQRNKQLEPPILYATICLQRPWSVKEELRKTPSGSPHIKNGYFVVEKDRARLHINPEPVATTDESEADQGLTGSQPQSHGEGSASVATTVYTSSPSRPLPQFQGFWHQQGYGDPEPDSNYAAGEQGVPGTSIASSSGQHYDGIGAVSSMTSRLDQTNLQDDDATATESDGTACGAETDTGAFFTFPSEPESVANDDDDAWMPHGYPLPGGRHLDLIPQDADDPFTRHHSPSTWPAARSWHLTRSQRARSGIGERAYVGDREP
ncbi:hypothetical protein B0T18DRAFT_475690 [Schizothecium vesticola]|uniref:Uncharacterized protein n=1 Tax=Schizothecium vesticola TaxID=314040 RepID=A0AA40EIM3_9PEZI|nr:hypothetical protein B0T18DRAFT_475690 [Schizothecium vesticola]